MYDTLSELFHLIKNISLLLEELSLWGKWIFCLMVIVLVSLQSIIGRLEYLPNVSNRRKTTTTVLSERKLQSSHLFSEVQVKKFCRIGK